MEKKRFLKYLPVGLLVAAAAAVGITGATILHNMSLANPIKTPPVEITIDEKLNGNAKEAKFKNVGEADVFLRVAYGESWRLGDELLPNVAELTTPEGGTAAVAIPDFDREYWVNGGDGWWYYKKILKSGESTLPLTNKVDFDYTDDTGAYKFKDERYKDEKAEYQLHFTVEVVQASSDWKVSRDAVKKLFGKELGSVPTGWPGNKYANDFSWN